MKLKVKLLLLIIASVFLIVGCASSEAEISLDADVSVPVVVAEARLAVLYEKVLTLGEIEASAVYKVMSGRGTVEEIFVSPGELVSEGQILFSLDKDSLQNSYNAIESQLRTIRDNLKIQRDDQKSFFEKQEQLFEAGAISQADLDRSKTSYTQIDKQYRDAATNYANQISNLKDGLKDREIKSPIEGKIASVNLIENQVVSDIMAIEVIDDSSMVVNTNVTAEQINTITIGDHANVYPDGDRRKDVIGTVMVLNEVPNVNTGLYKVELQLSKSDYALRTGEYAEVETLVDERTAIVVPKKSVRKIGEGSYVYVAVEDIAIQREVLIGFIQGEMIEIISGVAKGEMVVVCGQSFLKDQMVIEIIE